VPFVLTCPYCGRRNSPHPNARQAVRMILLEQLKPCKGCGRDILLEEPLKETPMVRQVKEALQREGLWPLRMEPITWTGSTPDRETLQAYIEKNPHVVELDLYASQLGDEDVEYLAAARLPCLRRLNVGHTRISNLGMAALATSGLLRSLHSLGLRRMSITDEALVGLRELTQLQELYVSYTGDTGVGYISEGRLVSLGTLNLDESQVTDQGLSRLVRGVPNLTSLGLLRSTQITDNGLEALARLGGLTFCDLRFTAVTEEGELWLQARLPHCKIQR
jgi:hypothetical protein